MHTVPEADTQHLDWVSHDDDVLVEQTDAVDLSILLGMLAENQVSLGVPLSSGCGCTLKPVLKIGEFDMVDLVVHAPTAYKMRKPYVRKKDSAVLFMCACRTIP